MRTIKFLLFFFLVQIKAFSQNSDENTLINAFIEYKNTDEFLDSLKHSQNLSQLNLEIEKAIKDENILNYKKFTKIIDSLNVNYLVKKSEKNNLLLFTMSDNFFHWNYIIENKQIILKENKWHEYFTEIHNLTENEFLLIEQKDDLVFSCNYAYVFERKGNIFKKKKAFGNQMDLTLCNFTEIQNLPSEKPEHTSLNARKISFNYENKIIFYGSCFNSITGKMTIGKAKYINGNFKIKDCDERKGFE